MSKKLSDMSLDELWQLFPIILTEHQPSWSECYKEEADMLSNVLPQNIRISHIGSTSVKKIWAKPIIDILVEIPLNDDMNDIKDILSKSGWLCMSQSESRISFNKGYTENGFAERVFHLHLRYAGDNDELYFRDYLNQHIDAAKEYEKLKLDLWKRFEYDRDGYTNEKSDFIKKYTDIAKREYRLKYSD